MAAGKRIKEQPVAGWPQKLRKDHTMKIGVEKKRLDLLNKLVIYISYQVFA